MALFNEIKTLVKGFYDKYTKTSITLISIVIVLLLITQTNIIRTKFKDEKKLKIKTIPKATEKSIIDSQELSIMSWNIQFAGAINRDKEKEEQKEYRNSINIKNLWWYDGGDKIKMKQEESKDKLMVIIEEIKKKNPDIIFLQEICKWSSRTGGYNQVDFFINQLIKNDSNEYKYYIYGSYHKVRFIPVIRLKKLEGKIDMGNMIISKFPITNAVRHQLALRTDTSALESFFDLRRNAITCEIEMNNKPNIFLLNTHLSAFALDGSKNLQMNKIFKLISKEKEENKHVIFGGDFNTVPPGCLKTVGYEDRTHVEDFLVDLSLSSEWIQTFLLELNSDFDQDKYKSVRGFHLQGSVELNTTSKLQEFQKYVGTHGNRGEYNRKIDYIFSDLSKEEIQENFNHLTTEWLSDHMPIIATYKLE